MTEHGVSASERLVAFAANKCCRDKIWIVVALEVHVQKLFLPECLLTLGAGKWLFPCVCPLVHHHVAFLSTAVVTHVTLESFLIFVSLLVLNKSVSLMEHSITIAALFASLNK